MDAHNEHQAANKQTGKKRFMGLPVAIGKNVHLWVVAAAVLLGVIGGYAYYALIGCTTGGCAITSNPYLSMVWGGLLGYLVPDIFVRPIKEKEHPTE